MAKKTFQIRVTQKLTGYYEGYIAIEATSEEAALKKLGEMPNKKIDRLVEWGHGDDYDGDIDTIEIDEDSICEL
jgi:hypothetical protein